MIIRNDFVSLTRSNKFKDNKHYIWTIRIDKKSNLWSGQSGLKGMKSGRSVKKENALPLLW